MTNTSHNLSANEAAKPAKPAWQRFAPLVVILGLVVAFFASGLGSQISFDAIALRYGDLTGWANENPLIAVPAAILIYAAATAISVPLGWLLTVTIGLLFGWALGAAIVVVGATIGATALFLATKLALADFFRARAGNVLNRMADGFRQDATSYMLFLRLAPIFPFWLVNVVPALLGVPLMTYVWTTFIGIIPGTTAYAFAGEGLRSIVSERAVACAANIDPCGQSLTPGDLVTPQILIAFGLLGAVSLIPAVLKRLRRT